MKTPLSLMSNSTFIHSEEYQNLFSRLKPLKPASPSIQKKGKRCPLFLLSTCDGQPFISFSGDNQESILSVAESSLLNELKRLNVADDFFGINPGADTNFKTSLWEAPYLIYMMNSVEVRNPEGSLIRWAESSSTLILKVSTSKESREAAVKLILRTETDELEDLIFLDDSHILCKDTIYGIKPLGVNFSNIQSLLTSIDQDLLDTYLTLFLTYFNNVQPELNGVKPRNSSRTEKTVPTLFLEKVAADQALYIRTGISIDSLSGTLPPDVEPSCAVSVENNVLNVHPLEPVDIDDLTDKLEAMILDSSPNRLAKKEVYRDGNFFIIPEETASPFLLYRLHQVLEMFRIVGSEKLKEYKVVAVKPHLNLRLSSGIDFLEGEGDIVIGNEHFTIADLLNQYSKNRYVQLSDGNRGIIDENYLMKLQRLFSRKDKNGNIKVNLFNLPEIEELIQSRLTGEFANHSREVLEGFNKLRKAKVPSYNVKATLRPYQNEGVKWLRYLYDNKLGGCLADDMGLGKTLQTIALLSLIYPGQALPSLIVMPRSLLFNWEKELKRFCPEITFSTYYGPDRNLEEALGHNVVLTTYALMRNDIMKLKDHKFEIIVLDESQNIKTHSSQTTMAVQLLDASHRFALSGTPIENNLTELYSLFRFLNPAMFGSLEDFNAAYTYPIQKYGDKDASESLRRKIFPFILRRLKKDVLKDLPPRIDSTRYVEMSESQERIYNERRLSYRRQIRDSIKKEGVHKSQFLMFQALNELRRISSVPESVTNGRVASPKIEELIDLLSESVSNGHKSVVFFNFLAGLEIVMTRLEKLGIAFETMTGSTSASERKRIVERFQSDPDCMVMLLTLKVGGVGLNLTAADTVYIFEPWWNRAAEEQAINRLHRIGQQSTVNSFSLITVGTIEEKILQLQEQKSELFNELISADGSSSKHLSEKDIDFILS